MKKLLSVLLVATILTGFIAMPSSAATIWNGSYASGFSGGTGSKSNPYIIKTAEQLAYFERQVNNGNSYAKKYIKLDADIALNDVSDFDNWYTSAPSNVWTPIGITYSIYDYVEGGDMKGAFCGTFDGNGHTISGMYVRGDYTARGLFGCVLFGRIKNITVTKSLVRGSGYYTGGIVGYMMAGLYDSQGENLSAGIENAVFDGLLVSGYNTGGIAGMATVDNYGTGEFIIKNCENRGEIRGTDNTGGLVGTAGRGHTSEQILIVDCTNTGVVESDVGLAGGIVGDSSAVVENCTNTASVMGNDKTGGICGTATHYALTTRCTNKGNVIGSNKVGGIVGESDIAFYTDTNAKVYGCLNSGWVFGKESVGGIVGRCYEGSIKESANIGSIEGNKYVGGICGTAYAEAYDNVQNGPYNAIVEISDCYNTGSVKGVNSAAGISCENIIYASGSTTATIKIWRCYTVGDVEANDVKKAAISTVGASTESFSDNTVLDIRSCFYLNLGTTGLYGSLCTADQLKSEANYSDFDLDKVWAFDSSAASYPTLRVLGQVGGVTGSVKIVGEATVGSVLTAQLDIISPRDAKYGYRWYRDGVMIENADEKTYTLTFDDLGKRIDVRIVGIDSYSGAFESSALTVEADDEFVTVGGDTYYIINNEIVKNIYIVIHGYVYYFDASGAMKSDCEYDGKSFDENGRITSGVFVREGDDTYCYMGDTKVTNRYIILDGSIYYFDSDGVMTVNSSEGSLNFDENGQLTGTHEFVEVGGRTYYLINNKIIINLFIIYDNRFFWFDANGELVEERQVMRGIPQCYETLTADFSDIIEDNEGISYEWFRDGVLIDGANGANYTVTRDDMGHSITVRVYSEMFPSQIGERTFEIRTYILGDINQTITAPDISDALLVFKHVAGVELITDESALIAADIDGNNGITISDSLLLFKFIAGIESALEKVQ